MASIISAMIFRNNLYGREYLKTVSLILISLLYIVNPEFNPEYLKSIEYENFKSYIDISIYHVLQLWAKASDAG